MKITTRLVGKTEVLLPNVTAIVLAKVVEYFNKHAAVNPKASATDSSTKTSAPKASKEELKSFDAKFVNVDKTMLVGLILAANYLNVKDLLDLTCQHAVDLIKDMTLEQRWWIRPPATPVVVAAGSGRPRAHGGRGDDSPWQWWRWQLAAVEEGEGEESPPLEQSRDRLHDELTSHWPHPLQPYLGSRHRYPFRCCHWQEVRPRGPLLLLSPRHPSRWLLPPPPPSNTAATYRCRISRRSQRPPPPPPSPDLAVPSTTDVRFGGLESHRREPGVARSGAGPGLAVDRCSGGPR
ncbi:hypothetical protein DAI22_08g135301 [Oryza sativa Japonica Group]|nr:hypothetical protein DAI22_08g135301 [Oryza sativa Japonica Group]